MRRTLTLVTGVVLALSASRSVEAQTADRSRLTVTLDSLARAHVADTLVPGVAVAVVHHGDTLLLGGYGLADLEWNVPMATDAIFEIGSVTKQFTAAVIMRLVEQGRLDLEADITTYLPDYDTQGRRIPVWRLLDHTSGIRGYTELPFFGEFMMRDLPRDSLVERFEHEPLDFEPGTAQIYNNSAYFLLGLIIEKVAGESYERYLQTHVFQQVGMTRSGYCDEHAITARRAHGYDQGAHGLERKGYLDHLWPYAAGSICSTAGDLVRWNQALHGGRVVTAESYRYMTTPRPLAGGTPIRYATGLAILDDNGRKLISHNGGINGFLSEGMYYPDEDLIVIVLQNSASQSGPGALSRAIVEAVIGPGRPPVAGTFTGDLAPFTGKYRGPSRGREMVMEVSIVDGSLAFQSRGPDPALAEYVDGLRWRLGQTFFFFETDADGRPTTLHVDQGGGHYVLRREEG